jgi:capsid assembly protease
VKPHKYHRTLVAFYGTPWAILPGKLDVIEAALVARIADDTAHLLTDDPRVMKAFDDGPDDKDEDDKPSLYDRRGSTALVKVNGTITPRPSLFSSGGLSAHGIGRAVDLASADAKVRQIVLEVDSPGGSVFGIEEAGDKIWAARQKKPVYAVANHVAASAAYWLGSQATKFYVAPSGQVGSIGVITRHFDQSKAMAERGVVVTTIKSAPHKDEATPYEPLSKEDRERLQANADAYYKRFVAAVARGRGVTAERVVKHYGGGRMMLDDEAVSLGMVDSVQSADATLEAFDARDARERLSYVARST